MVRFGLVRDEDARTPGVVRPVESEGLWASPAGEGLYRLEGTPWFADVTAAGDVVEAVEFEGARWVTRRMEWSGHLTVRVTHPDPDGVLAAFADLGVGGESAAPDFPIAALDIPPGADLTAIADRLRSQGWEYEESCGRL